MVFSLIIIVLIGIITFFHYVQGFFSSAISAALTVLAAVLALGYDETIVGFFKGKLPEQAHALVLCVVFGFVYFVLRSIFDATVPGAVHIPNTLDKVGAVLMGLVAGVFVTGIFAIAVQMLPFDPAISFMGYSRYATKDNPKNPNVNLPSGGGGQSKDTNVYSQMDDTSMEPEKEKGLLIPVDDLVLNVVYHLSDGGSLSGDRSLASIHPNYLTELFGERLGIQVGARRAALYVPGNNAVDVTGVFTAKSFPAADGQLIELRPAGFKSKTEVRPGAGQSIVVVRVKVSGGASDDSDGIFRFSPGSVRLVGPAAQGGFKDFFPVGMLENAKMVLLNTPDDFLFLTGDKSFDAVFIVDNSLIQPGKPDGHLAQGVFLGVKRYANLDLNGQAIKEIIPADPSAGLIRSKLVLERAKVPAASALPAASASVPQAEIRERPSTPAAAETNTPAAPAAPVVAQPTPGKDISDTMSVTTNPGFMASGSIALGTTSADPDAKNAPVAGGTMNLKGGMILSATVDPTASLSALGQGVQGGSQFYAPADRTLVQAVFHPYENNWAWISQLGATALLDSNGNSFPLSGFYAVASNSDSRGLLLRYDSAHTLPAASPPDGTLQSDVYLVFLIPHETDIKSLKLGGKQQNLDTALHVP